MRAGPDGSLELQPFRTYLDDDAGKAYADAHGVGFPFPDDHLDAAVGAPHVLELTGRTVCTGILEVGYRDPLADHVVDCEEFRRARVDRVPAAVWTEHGRVVQLSELYRP